jgi:hypothetical protein
MAATAMITKNILCNFYFDMFHNDKNDIVKYDYAARALLSSRRR